MRRSGLRARRTRRAVVTAALGALVLALGVTSLILGKTVYPLGVVIRVIRGETIQGATFAVGALRIPRMLTGVCAGFAFGVAGSTFQTMLRNPLASPDVIGVSSGASVAAVFCILVLRLSGAAVSASAVIAGVAVAALIYVLSRGGSFGGGRLILIGIGVGAMLNAVLSYLLLRAPQSDVPAAFRWLSGSLNGAAMDDLPPLLAALVVFCPVIFICGRTLKIMELGDDTATAAGARVNLTRLLLTLSAVALTAFATATTGPIAFVAFLSGPVASGMTGGGRASALPSGLMGSALVLAADMIGQFAFDTRFPVGVVTGIIGAPYLMLLLVRINKSGGSS
ncbi:MAG: iron ABC transporter permease [Oscillospiraceae bacterium]|jgi:iron complex transport system permease protein|nr:iron ABC transporter permease [Oscillospiraceae bacterium]